MTTTIQSNGSKWMGEEPDSIETLLALLETEPLDRTFEPECYGNFITVDPVNMRGEKLLPPGGVSFFGNFFNVSHVFSIDTTDAVLIERLTKAIRSNQQRPDYLAQPDEAQRMEQEEARRRQRDAKQNAERKRMLKAELASIERLEAAE